MLDYLIELFKECKIHSLTLNRTYKGIYNIEFSWVDMDVSILENKYVNISSDLSPFFRVNRAYTDFVEILKKLTKLEPNIKDSMDKYIKGLSDERDSME